MTTRRAWTFPLPPDTPPEVRIECAIDCLRENNARGWYEVAGSGGSFVEVLRDGQVATRVAGVTEHHGTAEGAAGWLARATETR
jgi:hypothetical protein